jgi:hypothetical protein
MRGDDGIQRRLRVKVVGGLAQWKARRLGQARRRKSRRTADGS